MPLLVGSVDHPAGASIGELYQATAASSVQAYIDIAILGLSSTTRVPALHPGPGDARLGHVDVRVVCRLRASPPAERRGGRRRDPGREHVADLPTTSSPILVLFTIASLFLLIRSHVFDEQSEWVRRRIGDPASISSVYLRGGAAFITAPCFGVALPHRRRRASAPLAGAWDGVEDSLVGISQSAPALPSDRRLDPPARARVRAEHPRSRRNWTTSRRPGGHDPAESDRRRCLLLAGDDLRQDRPERLGPDRADRRSTSRPTRRSSTSGPMTSRRTAGPQLHVHGHARRIPIGDDPVARQTPISVDQPTRRDDDRLGRLLRDVDRDRGEAAPYTVTALRSRTWRRRRRAEHRRIRARPARDYPAEIKALYLPAVPRARSARRRTPSSSRRRSATRPPAQDTPIDLADQIVKELKSSTYKYATDVRDLPCAGTSPRSSASPPTRRASASTTRRRWPSSCATWASRPGSPRASCRARAT